MLHSYRKRKFSLIHMQHIFSKISDTFVDSQF
nr:MAG TPA: hypothetical protein [Caudoviricetes sp.]